MATPQYNTILFTQVWDDFANFLSEWKECGLYAQGYIEDTDMRKIFYLLYSKYGNAPIAGYDINQWKYRMWVDIYSYAPTYLEKEKIQSKVRALSDEQLKVGTKAINNAARSPATVNGTMSMTEMQFIDTQSVTNYKKSFIEAYGDKWGMLSDGLVKEFLDKFADLFLRIVAPQKPLLYVSDNEEDN